ncbi:alkaline phosphatase family protein [Mucilaginibacter pallidiroseus]|uniref:Alkaline phosphatase family protein n=1 Tax=Mucilaginibacter pallidiroseus TaxID=2599295 RepID=A0A563UBY2_9SPHI|nr:nucleotide pyrophosphatase/phosphodiesterase family protein [Mucilaginibacter pallidiroseus]TWR28882.1 alkaline phosphatase family protein [Mucilaginibacter pallidiroseus]
MNKTVVINIVGLSTSVIGEHTPFLNDYIRSKCLKQIEPLLPALTTSVQSAYVTGKYPSETGIVGNGWYDKVDSEVKFWKQSNKLVSGDKIWDKAKNADPSFTCSIMFWWYNMYSTADYSVTPRPNYLADGRKMPDCYSHPAELRDLLQERLGQFPLFQFWGPGANIRSSQWISDASMLSDDLYNPTLSLVYLPHLDYCLQRHGPNIKKIARELREIDSLLKKLITFYERKNAKIILLSEYGIAPVNNPIHINRLLRQHGFLNIRVERGLELLDPGASKAFAVADHQIAHIYINDQTITENVKALLKTVAGVEMVLDREQQAVHHICHERAGDLIIVANENSWFTYYFWLEDTKAPDYARVVDIHKKPGYDPVEMFMNSKLRAGYKLLRKKTGLRYVMDVIPLDAILIKGSHGRVNVKNEYKPIIVTDNKIDKAHIAAVDVFDIIWEQLTSL